MKTRSDTFIVGAQWQELGGGVRRQVMGYDGQVMMVKVEFEAGATGSAHDHYHSQVTYVDSGRFEVTVGSDVRVLVAGDGFYAEPDIVHGVKCLEGGVLIDVFTPQRVDFL